MKESYAGLADAWRDLNAARQVRSSSGVVKKNLLEAQAEELAQSRLKPGE